MRISTLAARLSLWPHQLAALTSAAVVRCAAVCTHAGCASLRSGHGGPVLTAASAPESVRIALIGDCHGQWNQHDNDALVALDADLSLFVGDFGNEDVNVVQHISCLKGRIRHASIFGNHDAFFSLRSKKHRGRHKLPELPSAEIEFCLPTFDRFPEMVKAQYELLKDCDVGWGRRHFQELGLHVVGGRPFSAGGPSMSKFRSFYRRHWGITRSNQSCAQISRCLEQVPAGDDMIVIAHNGPAGLGSDAHSICGKDWGTPPGGDWGDDDLRAALDQSLSLGARVPLVVFGHMHESLSLGGNRRMVHVEQGTVYVNCAVVPRWRGTGGAACERHFTLVEMSRDTNCHLTVNEVRTVWAAPSGVIRTDAVRFGRESTRQRK
mmetsp:Transcript_11420/g.24420  ORF Transcript_11420/g.24420 Transcript_11420/m.24420 type:complete len:379 (-) Transcript_11420:140-1276(-)|eukprot:6202087-Pleurochrysis_carterae.AAC.3